MAFFKHLKNHFEQELYSNVVTLGSLLLTMAENDRDMFTPSEKYQLIIFYAHSLRHGREIKKSEAFFKRALQMKNSEEGKKWEDFEPSAQKRSMTTKIEIIYQTYLCKMDRREFTGAMHLLEMIPVEERTPKINMCLAELYHLNGSSQNAREAYEQVLKKCPLVLEAILGLIILGSKMDEVIETLWKIISDIANAAWIIDWIQVYNHFYQQNFSGTISLINQLEGSYSLKNNGDILITKAKALYIEGQFEESLDLLKRIRRRDPFIIRGMDTYAALLYENKKSEDLEKLSSEMIKLSEEFPECWVAIAYHSFNMKNGVKTAYLVEKAIIINRKHVEALILKGLILSDLNINKDALICYHDAYNIAPYRYEIVKGMMHCYIMENRFKEAISICKVSVDLMGRTPRFLTLYGKTLGKDLAQTKVAKIILKEALAKDETYLPAVYELAEMYAKEHEYETGIAFLKNQAERQSTCQIHRMLGDFFSCTNEICTALHHYSIALDMDPCDSLIIDGIRNVEQYLDIHPGNSKNTLK